MKPNEGNHTQNIDFQQHKHCPPLSWEQGQASYLGSSFQYERLHS